MSEIKIIHTADLHIGNFFADSTFSHDKQSLRNHDIVKSFNKIISTFAEREADLLVICGDFFEEGRVRKADLNELVTGIATLAPKKVFIIPGNHDFYRAGSNYDWMNWPENVTIFRSRDFQKINVPELSLTIYGSAFTAPEQSENLLKKFKPENDFENSLLLFHGSQDDISPEETKYNPFSKKDLENLNVTFTALGHYHQRKIFKNTGDQIIASYPGSPEPLSFKEIYEHSFNLVTLKEQTTTIEFIKSAIRNYQLVHIDCSNLKSESELIKVIKTDSNDFSKEDIVKIILSGEISPDLSFEKEIIHSELGQLFFWHKIKDNTTPAFDLEALNIDDSVIGLFIQNLEEQIKKAVSDEDEQQERILRNALNIGLKALTGRKLEKK